MHLAHLLPFIWGWVTGQQDTQCIPDVPLPSNTLHLPSRRSRGVLRPDRITSSNVWVFRWGLLPVGRAQRTSKGSCPGGILIRCLNPLNWLLSMRAAGLLWTPSGWHELFNQSLRLSPAPHRKGSFLLLVFHSLFLSVPTQSTSKIGEGQNIYWLVNWKLSLLFSAHHSPAQHPD